MTHSHNTSDSGVRVNSAWGAGLGELNIVKMVFDELVRKLAGRPHFFIVTFSGKCNPDKILSSLRDVADGIPFIGGTLSQGIFSVLPCTTFTH